MDEHVSQPVQQTVEEVEARFHDLVALAAALQAKVDAGTATPADIAELERVELLANFEFEALDHMGAFDPPESGQTH